MPRDEKEKKKKKKKKKKSPRSCPRGQTALLNEWLIAGIAKIPMFPRAEICESDALVSQLFEAFPAANAL